RHPESANWGHPHAASMTPEIRVRSRQHRPSVHKELREQPRTERIPNQSWRNLRTPSKTRMLAAVLVKGGRMKHMRHPCEKKVPTVRSS
ncbi:Hypothetical predicted protein, partial [Pelobates cultripes]